MRLEQENYPSLSVVIPVFNEDGTVQQVLNKVAESPLVNEVIVVDDFSLDDTVETVEQTIAILREKYPAVNFQFFKHGRNFGKGRTLRTAFEHVTKDVIVIQDADLEYDPSDYPALLEPIAKDRADVVYGSRFLGGAHRVLYFWHYVGNKMLTTFSNIFSNINLSDMETCYKMFRREILEKIEFKSNRFGFEPEFTIKVAKEGFRIYEVPISYHGRTYEEGKKITWRDGLAAILHIVRFSLFK